MSKEQHLNEKTKNDLLQMIKSMRGQQRIRLSTNSEASFGDLFNSDKRVFDILVELNISDDMPVNDAKELNVSCAFELQSHVAEAFTVAALDEHTKKAAIWIS